MTEYNKAHQVTGQYTGEQDVAKFPTRSHDNRGTIEPAFKENNFFTLLITLLSSSLNDLVDLPNENQSREYRAKYSERSKDQGCESPRTDPGYDFGLELDATAFSIIRGVTRWTLVTRVVEYVGILATRYAAPTAGLLSIQMDKKKKKKPLEKFARQRISVLNFSIFSFYFKNVLISARVRLACEKGREKKSDTKVCCEHAKYNSYPP